MTEFDEYKKLYLNLWTKSINTRSKKISILIQVVYKCFLF